MNAPVARRTVFHTLWFALTLFAGGVTWLLGGGIRWYLRLLLTLGVTIVAFPVIGILVVLLVIYVIIPRLRHGNPWSFEVDQYMLSMIGPAWARAGERQPANNTDPRDE